MSANEISTARRFEASGEEIYIDLTPSGTGTNLSWVGRFRTVEECERVRKFAGPANEENLDRLAAELNVRSQPVRSASDGAMTRTTLRR